MSWVGILAIAIVVGFVIFLVWDPIGKKHQRERFNEGKCPNCGIELRFHKQDSFHTYYRCPKCQYTAKVEINSGVDRRYCDIFDCYPHFHECERDCTSKQCKHYRDEQKKKEQKNKTRKIPPKEIREDRWPGMV